MRVPGGDYDAYVESHVGRLEALRRAGIGQRIDADRWLIPGDLEIRAQAYDASQGHRASLQLLSAHDLDRQVTSDGSTWLDRSWSTATPACLPKLALAPRYGALLNGGKTN